MSNEKLKNYYEILEIPTDASAEEAHQGYIKTKNAYSNDSLALYSLMSQEECSSILELIDEAYTVISDPKRRIIYDEIRGINQTMSGPRKTVTYDIPTPGKEDVVTHESSNASNMMAKIVAKNRFALEYPIDEEFEKKIEQTTKFTGELLRKIREYKQVDIPRLSDMTKVSKTYIRHIEDENVDKLPAFVYARGFVYQYAKCLKLNPELVATSYIYHIKNLNTEAE
ncbi:MAG: DnaJ domain-containing protein [Bacteriovoracaceae bacterium]|jgi:curved DNA-binding protein CbpA|nr:DnaJ domain-containing protein [Bacteriovoracaceae bacterium]